jgi:hypothetical protein
MNEVIYCLYVVCHKWSKSSIWNVYGVYIASRHLWVTYMHGISITHHHTSPKHPEFWETIKNAARPAGTVEKNGWSWGSLIRQGISFQSSPPRENCSWFCVRPLSSLCTHGLVFEKFEDTQPCCTRKGALPPCIPHLCNQSSIFIMSKISPRFLSESEIRYQNVRTSHLHARAIQPRSATHILHAICWFQKTFDARSGARR